MRSSRLAKPLHGATDSRKPFRRAGSRVRGLPNQRDASPEAGRPGAGRPKGLAKPACAAVAGWLAVSRGLKACCAVAAHTHTHACLNFTGAPSASPAGSHVLCVATLMPTPLLRFHSERLPRQRSTGLPIVALRTSNSLAPPPPKPVWTLASANTVAIRGRLPRQHPLLSPPPLRLGAILTLLACLMLQGHCWSDPPESPERTLLQGRQRTAAAKLPAR